MSSACPVIETDHDTMYLQRVKDTSAWLQKMTNRITSETAEERETGYNYIYDTIEHYPT